MQLYKEKLEPENNVGKIDMDRHAFLSDGNVAWWVIIRQTFTKKIPSQLSEYCSCNHLKCGNKKIIFSWMIVSFAAGFKLVTQRSSPQKTAFFRTTFLSRM